MTAGRCVFCDGPIVESRDYRRVTGWERAQRSAGGTNAIRVPERGEEWACMHCVDGLAKGRSAGQESLL